MALAALQEPLAEQPAGAERDLGLGDVIAGPERVALRIQKGQDPLLLVGAHKLPADRHGSERDADQGQELPDPDPREEERRTGAHQDHQRGPEVGLAHHQHDRHGDHQERRHQVQRIPDLVPGQAMKVPGKRQHQRNLHQLGGLQLERAEVDPPLRAHSDLAHHLDAEQQQEHAGVYQIGAAHPEPYVDHGDRQHDHEADTEPDRLPIGPGRYAAVGRRIQHGEANRCDRDDQQDHQPVHRGQFLAEGHLWRVEGFESGPDGHRPTPAAADPRPSRARSGPVPPPTLAG